MILLRDHMNIGEEIGELSVGRFEASDINKLKEFRRQITEFCPENFTFDKDNYLVRTAIAAPSYSPAESHNIFIPSNNTKIKQNGDMLTKIYSDGWVDIGKIEILHILRSPITLQVLNDIEYPSDNKILLSHLLPNVEDLPHDFNIICALHHSFHFIEEYREVMKKVYTDFYHFLILLRELGLRYNEIEKYQFDGSYCDDSNKVLVTRNNGEQITNDDIAEAHSNAYILQLGREIRF